MTTLLWVLASAGALLMSALWVRLGRAQRTAAELTDLAESIIASQEGISGIVIPPQTVQDINYLIAARQPFRVRIDCLPDDAGSYRRNVTLNSSPRGNELVRLERAWAASADVKPRPPSAGAERPMTGDQEEGPHDR